MTKDKLIAQLEAQFTEEERARIEKMSPEEAAKFGEMLRDELKVRVDAFIKNVDELKKLAVGEGVNVDGSKGVQFLLGVCAGFMVRLEKLEEMVEKHDDHLMPKMVAGEFLAKWRKAARERGH